MDFDANGKQVPKCMIGLFSRGTKRAWLNSREHFLLLGTSLQQGIDPKRIKGLRIAFFWRTHTHIRTHVYTVFPKAGSFHTNIGLAKTFDTTFFYIE